MTTRARVSTIMGVPHDPRQYAASERLRSNSMVGLELELESTPLSAESRNKLKYWEFVGDDSLRGQGAVEARFVMPLAGADCIYALESLETEITKLGIKPSLSDRTSVHVHVDVRDMDVEHLITMVEIYYIVEKLLYNYGGPSRYDNIFCRPVAVSPWDIRLIADLLHAVDAKVYDTRLAERARINISSCGKYSGLNLRPITSKGSVEFRMHVGEWRSEPLIEWINILLCIKEEATAYPDKPTTIPGFVSAFGYHEFVQRVFGKYAPLLMYGGMEADMLAGSRIAQDLLYYYDYGTAMEAMYQDVISPAPKTDLGRNYINQQKKKGMIDPKKVKKGTYVADAAEANALINGILRGNFVRDPPIPVEQPDIEEGPDGEIEIEGEVRRNFVGAAPGEFRWFPQGVDILDAVARGPMEIHMDRFQEALRDRREQERAQENARQVADANAMRIRDLPADRVAAPRRRIRHPRGIIN